MTTLLLNGSPRPSGETAYLIDLFKAEAQGEIIQFDCFQKTLSPCIDCRACVQKDGCILRDDMQELYPLIERSDRIVIASPVYFSLPTPPLLSVLSRMQTYFCAREFRGVPYPIRPKRGGLILTAGGNSNSIQTAEDTLRQMLRVMQVRGAIPMAASLRTDTLPAKQDAIAKQQINTLLQELYAE